MKNRINRLSVGSIGSISGLFIFWIIRLLFLVSPLAVLSFDFSCHLLLLESLFVFGPLPFFVRFLNVLEFHLSLVFFYYRHVINSFLVLKHLPWATLSMFTCFSIILYFCDATCSSWSFLKSSSSLNLSFEATFLSITDFSCSSRAPSALPLSRFSFSFYSLILLLSFLCSAARLAFSTSYRWISAV